MSLYSESKDETKTCSICKKSYKGFGNNAYPVNDGRCCDECNTNFVIPRRIKNHNPGISMKDALHTMPGLKPEAFRDKAFRDFEKEEVVALIKQWTDGNGKLEQPNGSHVHHFLDRVKNKTMVDDSGSTSVMDIYEELAISKVFVIGHDWNAAFSGHEDFDVGLFRLPYDMCVFELRVNGMQILTFVNQVDEQMQCWALGIGVKSEWVMLTGDVPWNENGFDMSRVNFGGQLYRQLGQLIMPLVHRQVRAVCIMLESEVALSAVIRAPAAINKQRERKGKTPLRDYHIVSLARRTRVPPMDTSSVSGRHVRCHWRRGHWRHYERHRTYIKWQLVGDPDLGFVDKEYKL